MNINYRVILEIRYNPNSKFTDNDFIGDVSNYLGSFGYQTNVGINCIDAINPLTRDHINTDSIRLGVDFNMQKLETSGFNKYLDILVHISNMLDCNFLNRIGLRIVALNNYDSLKVASGKISENLDIKNPNLNEIMSESEACTLSFAIIKGSKRVKLSILPNQANVNFNGFENQINTLNIDIDVSETNISNTINLVESKYKEYFSIIKEYNGKLNNIF